jgi:hypothetical protein
MNPAPPIISLTAKSLLRQGADFLIRCIQNMLLNFSGGAG